MTTDTYPNDYDECLDQATDEKTDHARPALIGTVENMADYDVIFLGYPERYLLFYFLDSYDFTGKIVIPSRAHGTSGQEWIRI